MHNGSFAIRSFRRVLKLGFVTFLLLFAFCAILTAPVQAQGAGNGDLSYNEEDLDFILKQIIFAERHAAGENLLDVLPNASLPWGLRTVNGKYNNLIQGQEHFGQADLPFTSKTARKYRGAQVHDDLSGSGVLAEGDVAIADSGAPTRYSQGDGTTVVDSTPRLISHLIVNQSTENPAAVFAANEEDGENIGPDLAGSDQFFIPNTAPDEGLSAPFNAYMTFFGQFFDHGLDLITKGGNGFVYMPLQEDDPLYNIGPDGELDPNGSNHNFMLLSRASRDAGEDGVIGTADDVSEPLNRTTPHVDQQQTYASHESSQVLLRHYDLVNGIPRDSGELLNGFGPDGQLDTPDDTGLTTWDTMRAQAELKLGIRLDDDDGADVPHILADYYGNFIPGPNGLPQIMTESGDVLEGDLDDPIDGSLGERTGHSFFIDIAHTAAIKDRRGRVRPPDDDDVINARTDELAGQPTRGVRKAGTATVNGEEVVAYDDELLGAHFVCGDGRCNENIALTAIHHVFHSEHNRLVYVVKRVLLDVRNVDKLNQWLDTPVTSVAWGVLDFPVDDASKENQDAAKEAIDDLELDWNGSRIFQAAKFGTEMQYNRIVFDEFSPTLAGLKDDFEGYHTDVDPSINNEFSQSVYRFGHSMLTETVDRFDEDFKSIVDAGAIDQQGAGEQLGLFEAFLNPLAYYNADAEGNPTMDSEEAAGAIIRGTTRTVGNEIDEFVTGSMQNNLLGLPLDLGAINIARGRDVGNPTLNEARRMFFEDTRSYRVAPYVSWVDFLDNVRHEPTIVNFVAAYGTHPWLAGEDRILGNADDPNKTYADRRAAACAIVSVLAVDPTADFCGKHGFTVGGGGVRGVPSDASAAPADALDFLYSRGNWSNNEDGTTITGVDDIDFWNGGLAEERMPFGGFLGSTHNFIFERQMESLQNGDRFYYVARTANMNFFSELESNSFTSLVMRNTSLGKQDAGSLPLAIFTVSNHNLEVDQNQQFNGEDTADPEPEAELIDLVIRDPARRTTNITPAGDGNFIQYTGGDHVTIGGTAEDDTIIGGIGDDSLWGRYGDDRIEGGDGADHIEGGPGNDILTDLSGPDVIEGGGGCDAISSGNEEDVIFGDSGNDFIVNPSEFGEIFAGPGDDFIFDGHFLGHIRGGAGDDWMENLGGGEDLFQADHGAAAEAGESPTKGNDVMIVHGGNTDSDMESGDDIVVDGPGIDRVEGQLGFDWISFQNDKLGVNVDLDLTIFIRPILPPSNDTVLNRYDRVEGISGSSYPDLLNGTDNLPGTSAGNELLESNMGLIVGLSDLVPEGERRDLPNDPLTGAAQYGWTGGEVILGGAGSDIISGEGGDDIIDGDLELNVALQAPGVDGELHRYSSMTDLQGRVFEGTLSPCDIAISRVIRSATEPLSPAGTALASAQEAFDLARAAEEAAMAALVGAEDDEDDAGDELEDANEDVDDANDDVDGAADDFDDALRDFEDNPSQNNTEDLVEASMDLAEALMDLAEALEDQAEAEGLSSDSALSVAEARDLADVAIAAAAAAEEALEEAGSIEDGEEPMIVRTDAAVYNGAIEDYTIEEEGDFLRVTDNRDVPEKASDGSDLLKNIERLYFLGSSTAEGLVSERPNGEAGSRGPAHNTPAAGSPTITWTGDLQQGSVLSVDVSAVQDADGFDPEAIDFTWQSELEPGESGFSPVTRLASGGDPLEIHGKTFTVTQEEIGLEVRVVGLFLDGGEVFEIIRSAPILIPAPPGSQIGPDFPGSFAPRNGTCSELLRDEPIAENASRLGRPRLDVTIPGVRLREFSNTEFEFPEGFEDVSVHRELPISNIVMEFVNAAGEVTGTAQPELVVVIDEVTGEVEEDEVELSFSIRGDDVAPLINGPTIATIKVLDLGCDIAEITFDGDSSVDDAVGVAVVLVNGMTPPGEGPVVTFNGGQGPQQSGCTSVLNNITPLAANESRDGEARLEFTLPGVSLRWFDETEDAFPEDFDADAEAVVGNITATFTDDGNGRMTGVFFPEIVAIVEDEESLEVDEDNVDLTFQIRGDDVTPLVNGRTIVTLAVRGCPPFASIVLNGDSDEDDAANVVVERVNGNTMVLEPEDATGVTLDDCDDDALAGAMPIFENNSVEDDEARFDVTLTSLPLEAFDDTETFFPVGVAAGTSAPVLNVTLSFLPVGDGENDPQEFLGNAVATGDDGVVDIQWAITGRDVKDLVDGDTLAIVNVDGCGAIASILLMGDSNDDDAVNVTVAAVQSMPAMHFYRGECNNDGVVDFSDAGCLLQFMFLGKTTPSCLAATDSNGDARVDVGDAIGLLKFLFLGGDAPVAPFPACGASYLEADRLLGCDSTPKRCLEEE